MKTPRILRLNLLSPLIYVRDEGGGPEDLPFPGEGIICFEVNPAEALSLEPEGGNYLGPLVFRGRSGPEPPEPGTIPKPGAIPAELPRGQYFFAQERTLLNREDVILMAMEVQKEAVWEGLIPETRLYIRCLAEDGAWVTQVFRPVKPG